MIYNTINIDKNMILQLTNLIKIKHLLIKLQHFHLQLISQPQKNHLLQNLHHHYQQLIHLNKLEFLHNQQLLHQVGFI